MKRHRKQKGYVYKASGVWYVRHHDDRIEEGQLIRKQVSTRIGLVKDFPTKAEAREEAERLLAAINAASQKPAVVQPITQFAESEFFPFIRLQVKPSTVNGYEARWRQLKPWLADLRLRDTETPDVQQILTSIHKQNTLNHDSIRALRYLLKMIFDHAIRMGLLKTNPVDSSKVPKRNEDEDVEDTYAYRLEEVQLMLNVLPEPARTAAATCAFTGVRRGELAGLLWENFDPKKGSMRITQSIWEGHITKPKTKKSKAPVPIIPSLVRMLEVHRVRTAKVIIAKAERSAKKAEAQLEKARTNGISLSPEKLASLERVIAEAHKLASGPPPLPFSGPIFASANGTALNMNNLLNRQILPALKKARVEWHGWHAFRRGLGTNLKRLGVDLKTIQEILRHAHIATTADIYVKEVSEQAVEAMQRLEKHLEAELKKGPKSQPKPDADLANSAANLQQTSWTMAPYSD